LTDIAIPNVILIGSLRTGGAESAVVSVVRSLSESIRARTGIVVVNDPSAEALAGELGATVTNLAAGSIMSAVVKLRRYFRRHKTATVHAHMNQCIVAAGAASLGLGIRLVPYVHTFGSWKQAPGMMGRIKIASERTVVNRMSHAAVYVSQQTRRLHERRLGYRSGIGRVIPNVVSATFTNNPPADGVLKLVSVGRVERIKGFDWVLELGEFDEIFRDVRWTIVGDGAHLAALKSKARRLGRSCVRFAGAQKDVSGCLDSADVFFMPSLSEGLPVSMLEACKAGLPLVGTDVGSIREIVHPGANGFVLPVGDGVALRGALAALRSAATRRAMGRQSRRVFAEHYDPNVLIPQIEELMA